VVKAVFFGGKIRKNQAENWGMTGSIKVLSHFMGFHPGKEKKGRWAKETLSRLQKKRVIPAKTGEKKKKNKKKRKRK